MVSKPCIGWENSYWLLFCGQRYTVCSLYEPSGKISTTKESVIMQPSIGNIILVSAKDDGRIMFLLILYVIVSAYGWCNSKVFGPTQTVVS